jgi:hypothetical protein
MYKFSAADKYGIVTRRFSKIDSFPRAAITFFLEVAVDW